MIVGYAYLNKNHEVNILTEITWSNNKSVTNSEMVLDNQVIEFRFWLDRR